MSLRTAVLLPWASGLTYCALRRHEIRKSPTLLWALAGMGAFALSAFLTGNMDTSWAYSFWLLGLCMLFLLFLPESQTITEVHSELFSLSTLFVTLYMPFALLAMISVFTGQVIELPGLKYPVGIQRIGYVDSRIRIFVHANKTARFAACNILFCVYALCRTGKIPARAFFAFNLLLNAMIIAHTQSRTICIAMAVVGAATALHCLLLRGRNARRILAAVLAAAILFALILTGINSLYLADVTIASSGLPESKLAFDGQTRAEIEGQFDMLGNGRDNIWLNTLKHLLSDPKLLLTGMGPGDVVSQIDGIFEGAAHLHNSLLAALAHYGLPYLICILGLLCTLVRPCLQLLFRPATYENRGAFVAALMVGMMLLISIPEEMLFTVDCHDNLLFFLFCGYALKLHTNLK